MGYLYVSEKSYENFAGIGAGTVIGSAPTGRDAMLVVRFMWRTNTGVIKKNLYRIIPFLELMQAETSVFERGDVWPSSVRNERPHVVYPNIATIGI